MAVNPKIEEQLRSILCQYKDSFTIKEYREENNDHDVLMDVFGITPDLKRENRQYWGTQLGRCWEKLVRKLFEVQCPDYQPPPKIGRDEPCDCLVGKDAIDTKYRIGSGDAGTLKKFRQCGNYFISHGLNPVLLILREDNLSAAITAYKSGGWNVLKGAQTFDYIADKTKFDLLGWLNSLKEDQNFKVRR